MSIHYTLRTQVPQRRAGKHKSIASASVANRGAALLLLAGALLLFSLVVLGRLWQLQILEHRRWVEAAKGQQQKDVQLKLARRPIVDREGRPLAVSAPTLSLGLHPRRVKDKRQFIQQFEALSGLSNAELEEKLNAPAPFVWLKRDLPYEQHELYRSLDVPGLVVFKEFDRLYPQETMAGAVLGFVGRDGRGLSGMELSFDKILRQGQTQLSVRRDARGTQRKFDPKLTPVSLRDDFPALHSDYPSMVEQLVAPGEEPIALSLDSYAQAVLERELVKAKDKAQAKSAYGLILDADTGELIAMGQSEPFNPGISRGVVPELLRVKAIQEVFEPGSTIKPFVAAAAMDAGEYRLSSTLDCEGGNWRVGRHTIKDVHKLQKATLEEALVHSSNVCLAKTGQSVGKQGLYEAYKRFGFGQKTGIELGSEEQGLLRHAKRWRSIDVVTHSFGYGLSTTALQLARNFSMLMNGGYLVKPTILKVDSDSKIVREKVLASDISLALREALYGVTERSDGTGRRAKLPWAKVAGKAGTAQKVRRDSKGYDPDRVRSSFVGFVDGEPLGIDRRFTMVVVIDEPSVSPRWGGTVAAPVFRSVMEDVLLQWLTKSGDGIRTALLEDGKRHA